MAGLEQGTDADWAALLDGSSMEAVDVDDLEDDLFGRSDELGRVSRRIAAQYAEVISTFTALAFRAEATPSSTEQVLTAIGSMHRLAEAAQDQAQSELLVQVKGYIRPATTGRSNSRKRRAALISLREWIPQFCETLEPEDAQRLASVVSWEEGSAPLLDKLGAIRGLGPKRLATLYAAGLHSIDVVASAQPEEIVAVTGLPLALAQEVVRTTVDYAVEERRRCIQILRDRAIRLRESLSSGPRPDDDLLGLAEDAIREVESTFRDLHSRSTTT